MKDNFDKIIADKANSYKITPPEDMWSRIETSLDSTTIAPIKANRRLLRIFSVASISAMVLISLLIMTNIDNKEVPYNNNNVSEIKENPKRENPAAITAAQNSNNTDNLKIERNSTSTLVQQNIVAHLPKQLENTNIPQTNSTCDSHSLNNKKSRSVVEVIDSMDSNNDSNNQQKDDVVTPIEYTTGDNRANIAVNLVKKKRGLIFGFNGGGNFSSAPEQSVSHNASTLSNTEFINIDKISSEMAASKVIEPTWRHDIPLSFSFTALKMLNDRIGIEAGLTYTYLSSQSNTIIETNNREGYKQNIHYIGIPISFYYNIINSGDFSLYAKCGILVDKAVSSNIDRYEDNKIIESAHLGTSGVQVSAIAKIGASYDISSMFSLYIEPTANYYFDSNQPASYRTDNDFGFSASLGFRVRL